MTEGRHDMTAQPRLLGGRYQVGELLGYGGMAEVHRGRDLRLGRDVAIKTLRSDLARDATFQLRFQREAQNAASLNHPAIVAVYDTGSERGPAGEDLPYIVMEFVNGRTLKEVLAAEGRLMPRRALEVTADICAALEFSHRHGIIHRDIKPGNVMLTQTGQVKVMDFGIARALASGASTMTQTSAVIGTAQYLSPEQARGEPVDARSDVYATGCVLFELLCGHPPFTGDNPVSVAYQHVREDPRPPSDTNHDVTPDVDAVVLKALAKNPLNRYQSAGEMRADLLRAAAGRPVSAPPVMHQDEMAAMLAPPQRPMGPPTRNVARVAQRQRRRSSAGVIAGLTVLGLLAVGVLVTGLYLANRTTTVNVPDLKGKTNNEARDLIEGQKLRANPTNQQVPNCVPNQVLNQSPAANTPVEQGSIISYNVCLGPTKVRVPYVKGRTRDDVTKVMSDNKLTAKFTPVDSFEPANTAIETVPAADTEVNQGTEVEVKISNGKLKEMPSLVGLTEQVARDELRRRGFTGEPRITFNNNASAAEVGKVTGQQPDPGKGVLPTSQVTIIIGRNPNATPTANPSPTVTTSPA
jgi:serine/threonine-protein kinase